jgi:hypothetical protein
MFRLCSDPPTTIDMMLINIDTPMFFADAKRRPGYVIALAVRHAR